MERVLWGLRLLWLKGGNHLVRPLFTLAGHHKVFLKKQFDQISNNVWNVEGNCIVCTSATLYISKILKC